MKKIYYEQKGTQYMQPVCSAEVVSWVVVVLLNVTVFLCFFYLIMSLFVVGTASKAPITSIFSITGVETGISTI